MNDVYLTGCWKKQAWFLAANTLTFRLKPIIFEFQSLRQVSPASYLRCLYVSYPPFSYNASCSRNWTGFSVGDFGKTHFSVLSWLEAGSTRVWGGWQHFQYLLEISVAWRRVDGPPVPWNITDTVCSFRVANTNNCLHLSTNKIQLNHKSQNTPTWTAFELYIFTENIQKFFNGTGVGFYEMLKPVF